MHAVPQTGQPTKPPGPGSHGGGRGVAALAAVLLLVCGGRVAAQELVPAVWKQRELTFTYTSTVAVYSCNALAGRVAGILRAVGARDDVHVQATHCDMSDQPPAAHPRDTVSSTMRPTYPSSIRVPTGRTQRAQTSMVRATFMMPAEITPDVSAELERDKSRRELVSHVTGNPLPRFNDPVKFAAQRQQVTLSRNTIGLEPAECELLEQMSSGVFDELGVDIVRRNTACDRDRVSHIPPEMVVEALLVAPADVGESSHDETQEGDADPGSPPPAENDGASQ